ncbi:C6 zinc finger domain-containing protein [Aspergillus karnatakaensis]|uniref:Zn(II)2Cys6 transcription factor domain-containing protein n=1 Tax=Aspergillus karnatakaensis TaxID=1810916 RepID=UPI003CCD46D9
MVGVAGKSKGCNTCRKRKIACDQQKPVCGNCTRSKRICGGYRKETVFVLVQPAAEKTHTFLRARSLSETDFVEGEELKLQQDTGLSDAISSLTSVVQGRQERGPFFPETSLAYAIMHSHIERHNLVQAFLSSCFPSEWFAASLSWLPLLGELPTKVEALETSSAAIAAAALGHMSSDSVLVKQSLRYYTQALCQLRKALASPNLALEDGTLAACMALSLYEALECPNLGSEGYFNHCRGLIALVQARGQDAHSVGAGHRLFLGVRVPEILFALKEGHSTELCELSWVERPWTNIPKTFRDLVTDCLAQAPAILERVGLLFHLDVPQRLDLVLELIDKCCQIDNQLDGIDTRIRRSEDVLYWELPSRSAPLPFIDGYLGPLFAVVFCFQSAQVGATLMLLWAARTMLWSGLSNLYQLLESTALSETSSRFVDHVSLSKIRHLPHRERCVEYLSMAHRVCQSVEYFLNDEMLLAGPLSVSPALGIVASSLLNRPGNSHEREIAWIQATLDMVRRKGLNVLRHAEI